MRIITDLERAAQLTAWVEPIRYDMELPKPVARLFPQAYPAYVKLFHAMFEDSRYAGSDATWEEVEGEAEQLAFQGSLDVPLPGELARAGLDGFELTGERRVWWRDLVEEQYLDARANWRTLGRSFVDVSWPRRIVGPEEGRLDNVTLTSLIRCLEDSGAEQSCVMFLEDWVALMHQVDELCAGKIGLIAMGAAHEVRRFDDTFGLTPQLWWAIDASWFVYTDIDSCVTWVAGPEELVKRIESEPQLESRRFDGSATAFPDRRDDPSPPKLTFRMWWELAGYGDLAWLFVGGAIAGVTLAVAGDSPLAIPIWLSALGYGIYRGTRWALSLRVGPRGNRHQR